MFEDFDRAKRSTEGRGRMGVSFLISGGIFIGIMAALAAAIATARVVVKKKQRDVDVTFADLPRQPPKPKPAVKKTLVPGKRKAAVRVAVRAPSEIPQERPPEAEGELAEAGKVGAVEGFTDGEGKGGGGGVTQAPPPAPEAPPPPPPAPLPEQRTEEIQEPKFVSGCRTPEIPEALHSSAATIQIEVRMLVSAAGKVASAAILRSHPLVPDDLVLRCARAQVFEPAHLPDGTPVPYPFRLRFVFKPAGV